MTEIHCKVFNHRMSVGYFEGNLAVCEGLECKYASSCWVMNEMVGGETARWYSGYYIGAAVPLTDFAMREIKDRCMLL